MIGSYPVRYMYSSESRNGKVDFTGKLDVNEFLISDPYAVELNDSFILGDVFISTVDLEINGKKVLAGKALTFSIPQDTPVGYYEIKCGATTGSNPPQIVEACVALYISAPCCST